jgi:Ca-activated chloride channel family protein
MALRLLLNLSLLLLALTAARAQTADDFFHGGAMFYLSNNIPKAKEVVATGLTRFPEDIKLKKLEELLNQQQQSQQQQQQEQQEKEQQQDEQKQKEEPQKQEQSQENQKPQESKGEEKKPDQQPANAHQMTPQEAKQLLDAQKGEEQVLQFRPPAEPKNRTKKLKDW